jgi:hypothetical protein
LIIEGVCKFVVVAGGAPATAREGACAPQAIIFEPLEEGGTPNEVSPALTAFLEFNFIVTRRLQ